MVQCIVYRSGYKYQLTHPMEAQTTILPNERVEIEGWVALEPDGVLRIEKGYAWDGPSGPTWDTPTFMRGSLVHDACYQLLRAEKVEPKWRKEADDDLKRICREDGMNPIRAWWVHVGVRRAAGFAADPANKKKDEFAPKKCERPPADG